MLNALRYYWIISKGHRLTPWKSPYIQWRMETFFGHEAADLTAGKFFQLDVARARPDGAFPRLGGRPARGHAAGEVIAKCPSK